MAKYLLLDLILVAIIALCAWKGFRTGLINGICGVLAVVVALYGANLLSTTYSSEFIDVLEPFAGGIIDGMISDALGYSNGENAAVKLVTAKDAENGEEDSEKGGLFYIEELSEEDKTDVSKIAYTVYCCLGVTERAAEKLAEDAEVQSPTVSVDMNETITHILCERIMYIAFFAMGFLMIMIVFAVIGNIFDLAFGLPGHENLSHILGAILGAAEGIVIVLVLACLCRYLGIILNDKILSATWLTRKLIRSNLVANILGV